MSGPSFTSEMLRVLEQFERSKRRVTEIEELRLLVGELDDDLGVNVRYGGSNTAMHCVHDVLFGVRCAR